MPVPLTGGKYLYLIILVARLVGMHISQQGEES